MGATSILAGLKNDNTGKGVPGVATAASLGEPTTVVSTNGTTYVLDSGAARVIRISDGQATVAYQSKTTIGGLAATATGKVVLMTTDGLVEITGDGQSTPVATMAELGGRVSPGSQTPLAFDGAGNLYIGNSNHYQVLRRAVDGTMSLVAGNGEFAGTGAPKGDGGAATAAPMSAMNALVVDGKGNLLIGEPLGPIRKVAVDGTLSTIAGAGATKLTAGSGTFAPDGTKAVDLDFANTSSLAIDAKGRIYVGDSLSSAIVRIVGDGTIEFVGGDQGGLLEPETKPHPANQTRITDANGLAFDRSGALLLTSGVFLLQIVGVSAG